MQFSAVLLAAAAGLVSAQKFNLVAIRSGSDIQNDSINSDGSKLVLNGGSPTTYEVIGRSLYANGKPVQFGNGANIVQTDGEATKDIIVDGQDHLYVPNYDFTACAAQGQAYPYVVTNSQACKQGAIPFAARAIYVSSSSSAAAPASSAAASKASSAAASASHAASSAAASHAASSAAASHAASSAAASAAASKASSAAAAPKSEAAAGAKPTAPAVVSQINDGQIQAPHSTGPAQQAKPSAPPAQANGAASLGVSAVAGVVAVAMLF